MSNHQDSGSIEGFEETFLQRSKAFYEIAQARFDEQTRWVSTLDNRLTATFSLSAVIVALFAAAVVISEGDPPLHLIVLAGIVCGLFACTTILGLLSFSVTGWERRPYLRDIQLRVGRREAEQWYFSATDLVAAYYANASLIDKKESRTMWAMRTTAANAFAVSITAVITLT